MLKRFYCMTLGCSQIQVRVYDNANNHICIIRSNYSFSYSLFLDVRNSLQSLSLI